MKSTRTTRDLELTLSKSEMGIIFDEESGTSKGFKSEQNQLGCDKLAQGNAIADLDAIERESTDSTDSDHEPG